MKLAGLMKHIPIQPRKPRNHINEMVATTQDAIDAIEIGRLSNSNISGQLSASPNVSELEIDMANLVLLHTGTKPDQQLPELVMQFVRGLNAKSAPASG